MPKPVPSREYRDVEANTLPVNDEKGVVPESYEEDASNEAKQLSDEHVGERYDTLG